MARSPRKAPPARAETATFEVEFDPAGPRDRHDGWTPDKQIEFVEALAESGCVTQAAARVGMSTAAAYKLRRRIDAQGFRLAWQAALDHAVERLSDAAFSRAIHGVARPVFHQGEVVGERRYYDERLTMFILRYRNPERYGAWLDDREARRHIDGPAITLAKWTDRLADEAYGEAPGVPLANRTRGAAPPMRFHTSHAEVEEMARRAAGDRASAIAEARFRAEQDDPPGGAPEDGSRGT